MLSSSQENTSNLPITEIAPKIPTTSSEYEIAFLGLPKTLGADFSQQMNSQSMEDYHSKLREIE
jgi:hypothetical protein